MNIFETSHIEIELLYNYEASECWKITSNNVNYMYGTHKQYKNVNSHTYLYKYKEFIRSNVLTLPLYLPLNPSNPINDLRHFFKLLMLQ